MQPRHRLTHPGLQSSLPPSGFRPRTLLSKRQTTEPHDDKTPGKMGTGIAQDDAPNVIKALRDTKAKSRSLALEAISITMEMNLDEDELADLIFEDPDAEGWDNLSKEEQRNLMGGLSEKEKETREQIIHLRSHLDTLKEDARRVTQQVKTQKTVNARVSQRGDTIRRELLSTSEHASGLDKALREAQVSHKMVNPSPGDKGNLHSIFERIKIEAAR
jgi:hypothetical protein